MTASTVTLEVAQAQLSAWLDASLTVASGKEFWMNGQRLILEDIDKINDQINYWQSIETQFLRRAAGRTGLGISTARFR